MRLLTVVLGFSLFLASCAHSPATGTQRIEEASYFSVGGIDQWVTIRSDDARKPLLLLIHGGPGDVQSPLIETYAPYERDFVLVQWDQRGAGRTYEKLGDATPDLTLDRLIADGIDLAEQLHTRFPDNRLVLLGHSFGTLIGVGMAQRRPGLFTAYVGTGQVSRWTDSVDFQFDYLKAEARRSADNTMLANLEVMGRPDPLDVSQYFTFTRPLRQHMSPSDKAWLSGLGDLFKSQPGFTDKDLEAVAGGMNLSGPALVQAMVHTDLYATAPVLKLPVYVIQGRHDVSTPTAPAKAWFDAMSAPQKKFVVIESAGHFALATHQQVFLQELRALDL